MSLLRRGSAPVRAFALTMLAVFLVQSAWMLVVPPFRGMDEHDHAFKAAAVARGDWGWQHTASPLGWGSFVRVPADLPRAAKPICESLPYTTDDNCAPGDGDNGVVEVASSASQYNPVFYGIVGTVARPFSGAAALYVMRLATALLCAVLLGLAAAALRTWARSPWPAVGLVVAATPTLVYSTSIVAPNGVEVAAAALVWCALLGVTKRHATPRLRSRLVLLSTVGALPLVTVRALGPLWLALIVMTVALLLPREAWRWLVRSRLTWSCAALVLVCAALAVGWTHVAGTNALSHSEHYDQSPWPMLPEWEILWNLQAVAAFPARDEVAPVPLYAIALLTWWFLLAAAARRGTWRERTSLGVVAGVSFALPAAVAIATFSSEGTFWQGRYGYPYALGLWVLCGYVLDRVGIAPRRPAALIIAAGVAWGLMQVIGQLSVLSGQSHKSPLAHSSAWLQPPGWLVVVLTGAATLVMVRSLLDRPERRTQPPAPTRPLTGEQADVHELHATPSLQH